MADHDSDATSDDGEGATPEPVSRTSRTTTTEARLAPSSQPTKPRKVELDDLPDDPAVLREHLRRERELRSKSNQENAEMRRLRDEQEREQQKLRDAAMTETERLQHHAQANAQRAADFERRFAEAEALRVQAQVDIAVERAARDAGFTYPDLVPRLIDRKRVEVDDETSEILGVKEAVTKLAKDKPELLSARRGGGTPPRDGDYRRAGQPQRPAGGDDYRPTPLDHLRAGGDYSM
jgi:hypothetical protein